MIAVTEVMVRLVIMTVMMVVVIMVRMPAPVIMVRPDIDIPAETVAVSVPSVIVPVIRRHPIVIVPEIISVRVTAVIRRILIDIYICLSIRFTVNRFALCHARGHCKQEKPDYE